MGFPTILNDWQFPSDETQVDYKVKAGYVMNNIKDTSPANVEEITYEPKLATFEMDIMDQMGIKVGKRGKDILAELSSED